jgi:hypothetical protein
MKTFPNTGEMAMKPFADRNDIRGRIRFAGYFRVFSIQKGVSAFEKRGKACIFLLRTFFLSHGQEP